MRRLGRLLAVAVLAVGAGLGIYSGAAYADEGIGGACPTNYMCFWQNTSYGGLRFELLTQDSTFHNNPCYNCVSSKHPGSNGTWGDQASSYTNSSNRKYCFYRDVNYVGLLFVVDPGEASSLSNSLNDEASSAKPC